MRFDTGADNYQWLNHLVAIGESRGVPGGCSTARTTAGPADGNRGPQRLCDRKYSQPPNTTNGMPKPKNSSGDSHNDRNSLISAVCG